MKTFSQEEMKKEFLIYQAIADSIGAAFRHGCVYVKGIKDNDKQKEDLRKELANKLRSMAEDYVRCVKEDEHCEKIVRLAEALTQNHKKTGILRNRTFRIGIAQKALNLHLKFLWCCGWIQEPPHCPIDGLVLTTIGNSTKWTQINSIETYKQIISEIKQFITDSRQQKSLAMWEIELWNEDQRKKASNNR